MCGMLPSDMRYASGWGAPSVFNAEKCVVSNIWLEVMLGAVYCSYQLVSLSNFDLAQKRIDTKTSFFGSNSFAEGTPLARSKW